MITMPHKLHSIFYVSVQVFRLKLWLIVSISTHSVHNQRSLYAVLKLLWHRKTLICSFMQNDNNTSKSSLASANGRSSALKHNASLALERQGGTLNKHQSMRLKKRLSMYSSHSSSHSRINFGDADDDVHLCILCLRAIMNHQVWLEYLNMLCACSF